MYDTMLAKFKSQQEDILDQMDKHNEADEDYYIKASKLLELAKNAHILFEKAQIEQKRRLLNFVFQNSTLRGKSLKSRLKCRLTHSLSATKLKIGSSCWILSDYLFNFSNLSNFGSLGKFTLFFFLA